MNSSLRLTIVNILIDENALTFTSNDADFLERLQFKATFTHSIHNLKWSAAAQCIVLDRYIDVKHLNVKHCFDVCVSMYVCVCVHQLQSKTAFTCWLAKFNLFAFKLIFSTFEKDDAFIMSLLDSGYSKVKHCLRYFNWNDRIAYFMSLYLCHYYFHYLMQCLMESPLLPVYISKLREIQYAVRQQSIIATQQVRSSIFFVRQTRLNIKEKLPFDCEADDLNVSYEIETSNRSNDAYNLLGLAIVSFISKPNKFLSFTCRSSTHRWMQITMRSLSRMMCFVSNTPTKRLNDYSMLKW